MTPAPNRTAYSAWLAVCVLWGTTYLAIAIALETLPPLFMAGFRYIVAGTLLVAVLKVRGEVEGLDEAGFVKAAEAAKEGCPVSKALTGTTISLDAGLA